MKKMLVQHTIPQAELIAILPFLPEEEPVLRGKRRIPVSEPFFSAKEERYLLDAFRSSWISSQGEYVRKFERQFSRRVAKTSYGYAVNSGTSALHIALAALGIGPGDEVILPTFTMIATLNTVLYIGATPVLVDALSDTWNMNTAAVADRITKNTKAIIVVHIYGMPVDMKPIRRLARTHNLWVIEDAAEAQGAEYDGNAVGSLGDVAAFSFYANKTLTAGEGGMITTDNPEIARRVELLRRHAFSHERHFWHTMLGFGSRITNLQAAIGLAQTERAHELTRIKIRNARLYRRGLKDIPGITFPPESPLARNVYWMYGIVIDANRFGISRNELRRKLAAKGIETRSFFIPMHWQPVHYERFRGQRFPVAEQLCRDGLYLPSSTRLKPSDITFICNCIRAAGKKPRQNVAV